MYIPFTLKGSSLTLTDYTMPLSYKLHHSGIMQDFFKVRYVFWCLGMLGMAVLYALRGNLSIAIVAMVNHTAISQYNLSAEFTSSAREEPCDWVNEEMQDAEDGELNWDSTYQAFILSGFFYGYLVGQIPGGILTERFHGKLVFGLGLLVTAIFTIISPFTLWVSGELFFVTRLLEGLAEVRLVLSTGRTRGQRRQSSLVWLTERNDAGIAIHDHEVGTPERKKQILRNVFSPPIVLEYFVLGITEFEKGNFFLHSKCPGQQPEDWFDMIPSIHSAVGMYSALRLK
uniref:Uncharacterized protein n=1 Tax=Timema bartmani TaxID=61472 RepID=A0A7R9EUH3_9NEOP|nr:unnamed protein product [Timema bartmani]